MVLMLGIRAPKWPLWCSFSIFVWAHFLPNTCLLFFLLLSVFSKRRAIVHDMTCAQWFASTTAVYGRVDTRTIVIFLSLCISAWVTFHFSSCVTNSFFLPLGENQEVCTTCVSLSHWSQSINYLSHFFHVPVVAVAQRPAVVPHVIL